MFLAPSSEFPCPPKSGKTKKSKKSEKYQIFEDFMAKTTATKAIDVEIDKLDDFLEMDNE